MYLHKLIHQFKILADEQSFTRASDKLCISQPTLTLNIQRLEGQLGVQLLIRQKKGVLLTYAGETLYKHACLFERSYNQALYELDRLKNLQRHTLVLYCGYAWTHGRLITLLRDYIYQHPDLKIVLKNITTDCGQNSLLAGVCDIAFGAIPVREKQKKEINYVNVFNSQFVLFCRNNHPLTKYRLISLTQLDNSEWIILKHEDREFTHDPYTYPCRPEKIRFEVHSVANALALAGETDCLITLPVQLQSAALSQGLVLLNSEFIFKNYDSGIMYTDEALLQPHKKSLIDTIIDLKGKFADN